MHHPVESRFMLGGSLIWRQARLLTPESFLGIMREGSLKFRVPREPPEPQNALPSLLAAQKSRGPISGHQDPKHSKVICALLHTLLEDSSHGDGWKLQSRPRELLLLVLLLLGKSKKCPLVQFVKPIVTC